MEKILLTPHETAEITGIAEDTIRKWCNEGKPFATRAGRNWKISKNLIQNWIDEKCRNGEVLW